VGRTALIVTDMLNPYEHEDAAKLVESVEQALPNVVALRERAVEAGVPVIYVNDNHEDWESSRDALIESALDGARPDLVQPILPGDDDLFLAKTRHSIFYSTPVEHILGQEGIDHIVLSGQVTEQCILYSALDAYIRHIDMTVPRDAVAHIFEDLAGASLTMMERNMHAEVCEAGDCRLGSGTKIAPRR
jgi:nicotinamidase-related amidase